jgi:hypothetical protein
MIRSTIMPRVAVPLTMRNGNRDGRLSLDEFTNRVDQVYRATTQADLVRITDDLPRPARSRHDH